jgi:probable HAF family extracellular repeat protein
MTRIGFWAIAVVSLVAFTTSATAERLPRPLARGRSAGPRIVYIGVTGINDRGQIVGNLVFQQARDGSYYMGSSKTGAFVWENGKMTLLASVAVAAINDRGQVIGTKGGRGIEWENGKMRDLGRIEPTAINDGGQILGEIGTSVSTDNGFTTSYAPVIWEKGKVRSLPVATAINDRGQVVGETADGEVAMWQDGKVTVLGPGSAVAINDRGEILGTENGDVILWQNGTSTDLGPGSPVAINGRGEVLGVHGVGPGAYEPFVWQNGTLTDLGTLGGAWLYPTAISDRGQVVGYGVDGNGRQHGFVWQQGTMTILPSPPRRANLRTRAMAINDHDQIVGDNCLSDCETRSYPALSRFAFLWTLTPHGIATRILRLR